MDDPFVLRVATVDDAERVAALHAISWRSAYRGSFSDAYLDGPVEAERRSFWRERFEHPRAGFWTVLAEEADGVLQGFLCLLADHDPHWGTLIDNLHARPDRKGRGLGRALMRAAADHLIHALPRRPVHLDVLECNEPAQAFYRRLGGVRGDRFVTETSDGGRQSVFRFAWPSPAALAEGAA